MRQKEKSWFLAFFGWNVVSFWIPICQWIDISFLTYINCGYKIPTNALFQHIYSTYFFKIHFVLYLKEFLFSSIEYVICIFTLFILSIMYTKKKCVSTTWRWLWWDVEVMCIFNKDFTHFRECTYRNLSMSFKDFPLKL